VNPSPGPAEVEQALAEVFARPEFAQAPPSLLQRALSAAGAFVRDLFARFRPDVSLSPEAARTLFYAVLAVLIAAGVFLLFHLLRDAIDAWRARDRSGPVRTRRGPERALREDDWEARADAAAREGRWRDAALALYQVLLIRLEEHGALRRDASKTPGDYRRELRADPAAAGVLRAFLRRFEPVAFGGRAIDAAEFERLRSLASGTGAHA
jgi:hypothetical protein